MIGISQLSRELQALVTLAGRRLPNGKVPWPTDRMEITYPSETSGHYLARITVGGVTWDVGDLGPDGEPVSDGPNAHWEFSVDESTGDVTATPSYGPMYVLGSDGRTLNDLCRELGFPEARVILTLGPLRNERAGFDALSRSEPASYVLQDPLQNVLPRPRSAETSSATPSMSV